MKAHIKNNNAMKKTNIRELSYNELVEISGGGPGDSARDFGNLIGRIGGHIVNMFNAAKAVNPVTDDQWMVDVPPNVLFGQDPCNEQLERLLPF